ncbi:poly(A) polymerase [Mergibacter septicus]|uniref:polynucleotide adenylyltransferase PcnB n=1 Tax=Mergibacter septicus TaxID=221402 RepID=UPI001178F355|nr:polynucleotide adenylyltransferase PcnB [Mergibacter septicus]AWX13137.1 poly(A) polymerase [Mergibacter septicus]
MSPKRKKENTVKESTQPILEQAPSQNLVENTVKINKKVKSHKKSTLKKKTYRASSKGIYPNQISRNALFVIEQLQTKGFEAYVVGGCLRDILLGKKAKDFDIATNARPEQIQKVFQRRCLIIGRRFRLAHILLGRELIEVATFRASHTEATNNAFAKQNDQGMLLRDNVYGNLEDDAQRRDFTVNALYYDPQTDSLYDFFNGLQDLKQGKLSLIGDPIKRYQEDPVRMLRAIRFMAKLDMFLAPTTAEPIKQTASLLQNIPAARLFDESLKLLQSGYGLKTYRLLREYGLFQQLFPLLVPFFTAKGDSYTEKMIVAALGSTDERIRDQLRINPAFLFAAFLWYPLREKIEILKNEGGLNNHDAYSLAITELLAELGRRVAVLRRHMVTIRDIWMLQLHLNKCTGKRPQLTFEHPKFRAAYDLLAMRAEIEGGDVIKLTAWWHEYQLSTVQQREALVQIEGQRQSKTKQDKKKKYQHRIKRKKSHSKKAALAVASTVLVAGLANGAS